MAVYAEPEPLLVALGLHHDRPAPANSVDNALPQKIPNSTGDLANEDTWRNLKKPACQHATKRRRDCRQNENGHQSTAALEADSS